jgi:hypothetical protein
VTWSAAGRIRLRLRHAQTGSLNLSSRSVRDARKILKTLSKITQHDEQTGYTRLQGAELLRRLGERRRFMQVVTGARQVGKTTLVTQVVEKARLPYGFASADEPPLRGSDCIDAQWEAARLLLRDTGEGGALLVFYGGYPGAAPLIGEPDRWARYIRDSLIETTIARDVLLLSRVAEQSGGVASVPESIDMVDEVARDMAHQIRNQYTLGYKRLNQALDGSYRTIQVKVSGPEPLYPRTRSGYRAIP